VVAIDVVIEAGCSVRPYLDDLLGSAGPAVDAQLATLLSAMPRPADIGQRLHALFESDPRTHEWFLAFLDDPALVPPELQGVRATYPALGSRQAVSAARYRCPVSEHYVWYRPHAGVPVQVCPDHGCSLISP
jgi:hypothetical protein